jgi:hypothetical protein
MHTCRYAVTNDPLYYKAAHEGFEFLDSGLTSAMAFVRRSPNLVKSSKIITDVDEAFREYAVLFEQLKVSGDKVLAEYANVCDFEDKILKKGDEFKKLLPKGSDIRELAWDLELDINKTFIAINKAMQSLDTVGFSFAYETIAQDMKNFELIGKGPLTRQQRNVLDNYFSDYKKYSESISRLEKLIVEMKYDMTPKCTEASNKLGESATRAMSIAITVIAKLTNDSLSGLNFGSILIIGGLVFAILSGIIFSIALTESIVKSIDKTTDGLIKESD